MKESHEEFSTVLNDFKALGIDTTDERMQALYKDFQDFKLRFNNSRSKLKFEDMMKKNDVIFNLMNDLKAQRIDAGCDTAKIEELFKEYKDLKLAYNEYGVHNHEWLGLIDKLCKLNSKVQLFCEEMKE
ncbi:hypothetical protein TSUD_42510 [Trifolium subterraneum]|uniref:Uncharacterized protein n=1 Tax=Trifolium subterraneum TaxID=3900 RepID=A0A2Z6M3B3_TRISU|nr:hypothetical protein TSUD_42510 [Trifolium subterraneum]